MRSELLRHMEAGTTLVGHTVSSDLQALRLTSLPDGCRVVDVARADADGNMRSLREMARDLLEIDIHRDGERHCALQDAEVALRLHEVQENGES